MKELRLRIAGEPFVLDHQRVLWWPRQRSLLLCDVHFGKGSVLRRAGMALPSGQTSADLARLDALIERYRPEQLLVLGDLVHGDAPADAPWIGLVRDWRARHADMAAILIAGNHDRHFDASALGFDIIEDELALGTFVLRHTPCAIEGRYVLAGHVHPGVMVRDGWRRHRLPAFRFGEAVGLLPAFGALTGLHEQPPQPGERIVAVTPAGLLPLAAMS